MKDYNIIATNVRKIKFADCGLDIENNILNAPICECGCGNYMNICLEDKQDATDFCYSILDDEEDLIDCDHCAVFIMFKDNSVIMGCKTEDAGVQVFELIDEECGLGIDIVRELQYGFQFHCYGLLEEIRDGSFRIVME